MSNPEWRRQYMQEHHPGVMSAALPCPFCQSRRLQLWRSSSMYVECISCGANGPEVRGRNSITEDPARTAVERWNKRQSLTPVKV